MFTGAFSGLPDGGRQQAFDTLNRLRRDMDRLSLAISQGLPMRRPALPVFV